MRNFKECSLTEQNDITTLCKYAWLVRDRYDKEIKDKDILWENQYQLRQVVKWKIIKILSQ